MVTIGVVMTNEEIKTIRFYAAKAYCTDGRTEYVDTI
jgi:hypothetical protein